MKKRLCTILIFVFIFTVVFQKTDGFAAAKNSKKEITFSFPSKKPDTIKWDDNLFEKSAQNYQHDLAKISLALCANAYQAPKAKDKSDRIHKVLTKLGFDSDMQHIHYDDSFKEDTVGYSIAKKTIKKNGKSKTLAVVVIRGTYETEWYGNFNLANLSEEEIAKKTSLDSLLEHENFKAASEEIKEKLTDFLKNQKGELDLFITGHSRGGAVANLLAHELTKEQKITTKDHIYAYTFATPNVTKQAIKHKNIFNFVNGEDFVTYCPLEQWGFGKHGITINFQSVMDELNQNPNLLYHLNREFNRMTGKDYHYFKNGTKELITFTKNTAKLVGNVEEYYYQSYLVENQEKEDFFTMYDYFIRLSDLLAGSEQEKKDAAAFFYQTLFSDLSEVTGFFLRDNNVQKVLDAHMTESYMSWLNMMEEEDVKRGIQGKKEKILKISNPTTSVQVGESFLFQAKTVGIKEKVTWSVSNKKLADIDAKTGEFQAKKSGTVTITCKAGKKTASCKVKIIKNKKK